jgi:hypothetical protein
MDMFSLVQGDDNTKNTVGMISQGYNFSQYNYNDVRKRQKIQ